LKLFRRGTSMEQSLAIAKRLGPLGLNFEALDRDRAIAVEPQLAAIRNDISGALLFPDDESGDAYQFCVALEQEITKKGGSVLTGLKVSRLIRTRRRIMGVQ